MFSSLRCAAPNRVYVSEDIQMQTSVNSMASDPVILGQGVCVPVYSGKCDAGYYRQIMQRFSYRGYTVGLVNGPVMPAVPTADTISD